MDSSQLAQFLNRETILRYSIKTLAIVFSIFYLLLATMMIKQTQVMRKTIEIEYKNLFSLSALVQFILGLVLVFYSLFIL